MKAIDARQSRQLDKAAVEQYNIPSLLLMENAGRAVAEEARCLLIERKIFPGRILVFAGKGNNGGDGFAAARHLQQMGCDVKVILLADPDALKGDAAVNMSIWKNLGALIRFGEERTELIIDMLETCDLVIDAVFGSGFHGKVEGDAEICIEAINNSGLPVLAVDVPSGLDISRGTAGGTCIRAVSTVTFALPKFGLYMEQARRFAGSVSIADISIPDKLKDDIPEIYRIIDDEFADNLFPRRQADAHKGSCGEVLVVAGSRSMSGAAILCAYSCLRAGAGLVRLAVPQSVQPLICGQVPEIIIIPLNETANGTIAPQAVSQLHNYLTDADAVALGPGIGRDKETADFLTEFLPLLRVPCVIDADALNIISDDPQSFAEGRYSEEQRRQFIMTPHPGELSRLLQCSVQQIREDRLKALQDAMEKYSAVIVLKGAGTLVGERRCGASGSGDSDEKGYLFSVNTSGNAGMATAGSGDVLTGIIAALCAQNLEAYDAAGLGVYLHGLAGDLAAEDLGKTGMMAGDIIDYLPAAMKMFE